MENLRQGVPPWTRRTSAVIACSLAGCAAQDPRVGVSDPAIYTSAHIAAVPSALLQLADKETTMNAVVFATPTEELMRRFRQKNGADGSDPTYLVMDAELDQHQQLRTIATKIVDEFGMAARVGGMPSVTKAPSTDSPATSEPEQAAGAARAAAAPESETLDEMSDWIGELITASVQDSPFDRLDRAVDYYTAFLLKVLPGVGWDTRLLDVNRLGTEARRGAVLQRPSSIEDLRKAFDEVRDLDRRRLELEAESASVLRETTVATQQLDEAEARLRQAESDRDAAARGGEAEAMAAEDAAPMTAASIASFQSSVDVARANRDQRRATVERLQAKQRELEEPRRALNDEARNATERFELLFINPIPDASGSPEVPVDASDVDRLVLLTFQVHVDPGTKPNMMTGVRLRVVATSCVKDRAQSERWHDRDGSVPVDVLRLHPTRSYDIESQGFAELASRLVSLGIDAAPANAPAASASARRERAEEYRERRRFLSRLTKVASYADATTGEFGWNFYPTNLTTVRRSPMAVLVDFLTFQTRSAVQVDAFLEGGARDCAVWLLVPRSVKWIELEVEHVVASVDPAASDRRERRYSVASDAKALPARVERTPGAATGSLPRIRVHLPAWHDSEANAYFATAPLPR